MNKEKLLKEILDFYWYEYEIKEDGSVTVVNDKTYTSVDEALKGWLETLKETNKSIYEENGQEYNTWSKEEIEFICSL